MAREREPLASIDELFDLTPAEEEPTPVPTDRPGTLGRWLVTAVLGAAVIAGGAYLVLLALGAAVSYPLLFTVCFAVAMLWRAVTTVTPPPLTIDVVPQPVSGADADAGEPVDGLRAAVGRWEQRLSWTVRDPAQFAQAVRPRLAEIADERLRQRHGVTLASDPVRARELMGEKLWNFLATPPARAPSPRQVAEIVDQMERL